MGSRSGKHSQNITLARWLIDKTNTKSYRAGLLSGWKHPVVDGTLMGLVGGRQKFMEQAKLLEQETSAGKEGKLRFEWCGVYTDIRRIDYDISIISELCEREKIEDPRKHQLDLISTVRQYREEVKNCDWLCRYYEDLLLKLENGEEKTEAEDEDHFRCLNAIAMQEEPVWNRVFSERVVHNSKKFKKDYESAVLTVLRNYSPYYEEGMRDDELLHLHGIRSYAQTLEWKGALQYLLDEKHVVDTAVNVYGTVINTQTMEHSKVYAIPGCKKIMTIENKANYESMRYEEDTLYIFCHGFFSPKEVRFLQGICEIVSEDCEFYHWGDMDYGGIRIFQFIKNKVFSRLMPYRMGVDDFKKALEAGAGIPLKPDTGEKLEKLDAGVLNELKEMILETNMTIEQEYLL